MRVFASDIVKRMMGKLGLPEDESIQNSIVTRSLETAQKKIEGFCGNAPLFSFVIASVVGSSVQAGLLESSIWGAFGVS